LTALRLKEPQVVKPEKAAAAKLEMPIPTMSWLYVASYLSNQGNRREHNTSVDQAL
jgi:hypothetical protein